MVVQTASVGQRHKGENMPHWLPVYLVWTGLGLLALSPLWILVWRVEKKIEANQVAPQEHLTATRAPGGQPGLYVGRHWNPDNTQGSSAEDTIVLPGRAQIPINWYSDKPRTTWQANEQAHRYDAP
jgi:hypothetical protein